jgi:hypothetical protein
LDVKYYRTSIPEHTEADCPDAADFSGACSRPTLATSPQLEQSLLSRVLGAVPQITNNYAALYGPVMPPSTRPGSGGHDRCRGAGGKGVLGSGSGHEVGAQGKPEKPVRLKQNDQLTVALSRPSFLHLRNQRFKDRIGHEAKTLFLISRPANLSKDRLYATEQRLIDEIKQELREGRRCQVYAVYTQKHDVASGMEQVLTRAGL